LITLGKGSVQEGYAHDEDERRYRTQSPADHQPTLPRKDSVRLRHNVNTLKGDEFDDFGSRVGVQDGSVERGSTAHQALDPGLALIERVAGQGCADCACPLNLRVLVCDDRARGEGTIQTGSVSKNCSPARKKGPASSFGRTHTTRLGMANGNPPLGTIPTHSPGTSL
jgi:hypothetical protein